MLSAALFEGMSFKDYLEQAVTEDDPNAAAQRLEGRLTEEQIHALQEKERILFGEGGDVRRELAHLNEEADQESYIRLLPGYVRRFVEKATPLLYLEIDGDLGSTFSLRPVTLARSSTRCCLSLSSTPRTRGAGSRCISRMIART